METTGEVNIHGKNYKTVALRISEFRKDQPIEDRWCVRTEIVASTDEIVVMKASVAIEGCIVGTGYAEEIRGSSNINTTSALENCETSAIGRALAACGYAGEEYASADEVTSAIQSEQDLKDAIEKNQISITLIKEGIECGDLKIASETWFNDLDETAKRAIWVAPKRGGPFTTQERAVIASKEFREANDLDGDYEGGTHDAIRPH